MFWYRSSPQRWKNEIEIAKSILSNVKFGFDQNKNAFIQGSLIVHLEHTSKGPFEIKIIYPKNFPQKGVVPSIILISHRDQWEKGKDSHIEDDWKLCVFVPGESYINFLLKTSLIKLLQRVASFLVQEDIYQRTGQWIGPQRDHGEPGIVEAISAIGKIGRNDPCPCGKGLKYKKCHGKT